VQSSDSKKRFVEIWSKDSLLICKEVTEEHDSFYTDGESINRIIITLMFLSIAEHILSLSFNSSERCVVYSAEAHAPKQDDESDPYAKFRYNPHLGEGLAGKRRPTLYFFHFSLDSKESSITSYAHPDNKTLFGQATFAASQGDVDILYATGYENLNNGRRLGIKWCLNRPTVLWRLELSKITHQVHASQKPSIPGKSYRSPRLLGNQLYWLASDNEGVGHASCSTLYSSDALVSTSKCLVDVVWDYKPTSENGLEFPGLFPATVGLPVYPFLSLGSHGGSGKREYIVLSSAWGSRATIVLIDLASGQAKDLTPIGGPADISSSDTPHYILNEKPPVFSWSLLCTDGAERIVCSRSAPGIPPEVVLGTLLPGGAVRWAVIDKPSLDEERKFIPLFYDMTLCSESAKQLLLN
jgi:acylaminoacyl-peptidase